MDLKDFLPKIESKPNNRNVAINWIYSKFVQAGRVNVFKANQRQIEDAIFEANYNAEFDEHFDDISTLLYGEHREGTFVDLLFEDAGFAIKRVSIVYIKHIDDVELDEYYLGIAEENNFEGVIEFQCVEDHERYIKIFKDANRKYHDVGGGIVLIEDGYTSYENLIYVDGDPERLSELEDAWCEIASSTDLLMSDDDTILMICEAEGTWDTWELEGNVFTFLQHGLIEIPYQLQDNESVIDAWNKISKMIVETSEVIL